jgi:hypothetical protein
MQLSYRNSGLHIESFFKSYDLLPLNLNENLYNGNFEIEIPQFIIEAELLDRYSNIFRKSMFKNSDWIDTLTEKQEQAYYEVRDNLIEGALILNSAWETVNYNEEIAYKCGLLPFKLSGDYIEVQLLSLWGCGMDLTYKLEAYQLLVDGTCDKNSYFARDGINYLKTYYSENSPVIKEIKKIIEG